MDESHNGLEDDYDVGVEGEYDVLFTFRMKLYGTEKQAHESVTRLHRMLQLELGRPIERVNLEVALCTQQPNEV